MASWRCASAWSSSASPEQGERTVVDLLCQNDGVPDHFHGFVIPVIRPGRSKQSRLRKRSSMTFNPTMLSETIESRKITVLGSNRSPALASTIAAPDRVRFSRS